MQSDNTALGPHDVTAAEARRAVFLKTMPRSLLDLEDALPGIIAKASGSGRSKLRRIYGVMDKISEVRKDFVACGKGCSDCCKMNVSISKLEARSISEATKRPFVDLSDSVQHPVEAFVGKPCPFLVDEVCSIYEIRPLACRRHASFHSSAAWCKPDRLLADEVPLVQFGGIDRAFVELSIEKRHLVIADVRDFFPT